MLLRRFLRHRLAVVGAAIVVVIVLTGIVGPFVAPYDPIKQDYSAVKVPPGMRGHLLGTDQLGRDNFSRILHGAQYTLLIGIVITAMEILIGVVLGVTSGYFRGAWDATVTRVVDVTLSIPDVIFALAIASTQRPGLSSVILALGVVGWRDFVRIARAETLRIGAQGYIEAARACGAGHFRIMTRHILPNLWPIIIVYSSLYIPIAIVVAAALSFLGVGIQPPTPEWGLLISAGRDYLDTAWWIATFPGLMLMLTVLGFNLLGDGLRDALDPRLRGVV